MKSRILTSFYVLVFMAVGYGCFTLFDLFGTPSNTVTVPVPTNTDWMVRVDAHTFVKEELYTILFDSKDDVLLQSIQETMDKKWTGKGTGGPLSINFQSDIVFYGIHENGKAYTAMLVQLMKPQNFEQNIKNYLKPNQTAIVKGFTGLILTEKTEGKVNLSELIKRANLYIQAEPIDFNSIRKSEKELITIQLAATSKEIGIGQMNLGIAHEPSSIRFTGSFQYSKGKTSAFHYDLKAKGLYFASRIVPQGLEDSLNRLLPLGQFKFSQIKGIVLDYNGFYLEETKEGMPDMYGYLPIPKMNFVVTCAKNISIDSIWKACPTSIQAPNNTLNFGNIVYQLVQLDAKTVFIGVDPTAVIKKEQPYLFHLSGNLGALTKIDGSSFVAAIIQNMGATKTSTAFFDATKKVDIEVIEKTASHYEIRGDIFFKEKQYPLNEVTKLLIGLKIIR